MTGGSQPIRPRGMSSPQARPGKLWLPAVPPCTLVKPRSEATGQGRRSSPSVIWSFHIPLYLPIGLYQLTSCPGEGLDLGEPLLKYSEPLRTSPGTVWSPSHRSAHYISWDWPWMVGCSGQGPACV